MCSSDLKPAIAPAQSAKRRMYGPNGSSIVQSIGYPVLSQALRLLPVVVLTQRVVPMTYFSEGNLTARRAQTVSRLLTCACKRSMPVPLVALTHITSASSSKQARANC